MLLTLFSSQHLLIYLISQWLALSTYLLSVLPTEQPDSINYKLNQASSSCWLVIFSFFVFMPRICTNYKMSISSQEKLVSNVYFSKHFHFFPNHFPQFPCICPYSAIIFKLMCLECPKTKRRFQVTKRRDQQDNISWCNMLLACSNWSPFVTRQLTNNVHMAQFYLFF